MKTITNLPKASLMFVSSLLVALATGHACAEGKPAGRVFTDCDVCPEMVVLPAGEFIQGSDKVESGHLDEKPQRAVKIVHSFAVAKTETGCVLLGRGQGLCRVALCQDG